MEDRRQNRTRAALPRRIEDDRIPGFPTASCQPVFDARGDEADAPLRKPVQADIRFRIPDRVPVFVDAGHPRARRRQRKRKKAAAAIQIEHAARAGCPFGYTFLEYRRRLSIGWKNAGGEMR